MRVFVRFKSQAYAFWRWEMFLKCKIDKFIMKVLLIVSSTGIMSSHWKTSAILYRTSH